MPGEPIPGIKFWPRFLTPDEVMRHIGKEKPVEKDIVYVLWWRYDDGSGGGVHCVYTSKEKAEREMARAGKILDSSKSLYLTESDIIH
jgi:hypothetical protein